MALIANARSFDGVDDKIQLATTGLVTALSGYTCACIVKPTDQAITRSIISLDGGTGAEWTFQIGPDEAIDMWDKTHGGWISASTLVVPGVWNLLAFTKTDGTSIPRFHRYRYDTKEWSHGDWSGGSATDQGDPSGSPSLWIGSYGGSSEPYEGLIALIGVWLADALTDTEFETGMNNNLAVWEALSPTGLWLCDQTSTSTAINDRIGSADQIALTGTSVSAVSDLLFDVGGVAAFPTTGILDTFTGSDEDPIATNWSGPVYGGSFGQMKRASNALRSSTGSFAGSYYDIQKFGPDCEVYVDVVAKPDDGKTLVLGFRKPSLPTTFEGYELLWTTDVAGIDDYSVAILDAGSSRTTILGPIPRDFNIGDGIGMSIEDTTLKVWHRQAGVWALIDSVTNATITDAGFLSVGMENNETSGIVDNFGGGTIAPAVVGQYFIPVRRRG